MDPRAPEIATDPAERVAGTLAIGDPARRPPPRLRSQLMPETTYTLIKFGEGVTADRPEKTYPVSGDHVYVEEVAGSQAVYLKLGPATNPWIRVREGATYQRQFGQLRLRVADESGFNVSVTVVLYVSAGPLVARVERKAGLDSSFLADDTQVATVVPQNVLGTFANVLDPETIGRLGGVLLIRNLDPANTLVILPQVAVTNNGFPLLPGETFQVTLDSKLVNPTVTAGPVGLRVACAVGTCAYAFLVSGFEKDQFDNVNPAGSGIGS